MSTDPITDTAQVGTTTSTPANGATQLEMVMPLLVGLVGRVGPGDLALATPCRGWSTRDLLNHVAGGAAMFADAFEGEPVRDISGRLPDVVGDDPAAAVTAAAQRFGDATRSPGAMDRVLELPWGPMEGPEVLRFIAFDLMVHSWDLATTLGVELDVREELVEDVDGFAHGVLDPWPRDDVNFSAPQPCPDGATSLERLVAYTGRRLLEDS